MLFAAFSQHAPGIPLKALDNKTDEFIYDITVDSGVLFGQMHEYVFYDHDSNGSIDYKESQLDWDLMPCIYAGNAGRPKNTRHRFNHQSARTTPRSGQLR